MRKIGTLLLTLAMLLSLPAGVFGSFAADESEAEGQQAALSAENGNLAIGKDVYANWSRFENESWRRANLNDGSFNETGSGTGGWHGGDAHGVNRPCWVALDFGEKTTFDTVVVYPAMGEDGQCLGMPNAIRFVVTDDESLFENADPNNMPIMPEGTVVYEEYNIDPAEVTFGPYTYQFEAVSARYLVFYGLSLNGEWYEMKIAELAVYHKGYTAPAAGRVNLAEGKTVNASTSHEDATWAAAKLTDGDPYNMNTDRTNNGGKDYGQFAGYHSGLDLAHDGTAALTIDIDLGTPLTLDTYVIYPSTSQYAPNNDGVVYMPENFDIQVSLDGETFTTVKTMRDYAPEGYEPLTLAFDPVEARYVRFSAEGVTKHTKISEIEIYGGEGASSDNTLSSGSDPFAVHYQTKAGADGKHDMRVVIVTDPEAINAMKTTFTVRVAFVLESDAEIYFTKKLGGSDSDYSLYRKVTASGDAYVAAEGYALFGNVVTNIPDGIYKSVVVTITDDSTGEVVFNGRS